MAPDKPSNVDAVPKIAEILGVSDPKVLAESSALIAATQRQLFDVAKLLGLGGVSRLNKAELAARVARALRDAIMATPLIPADDEKSPFTRKFEAGLHAKSPREESREIPWGYGYDRVTAMPVDPDRLYAYWEVTDGAILMARTQLGAGGPGAWLNLRVYDVTGRLFDGTNAHLYFDQRVERMDRQWFFAVDKPGSQAVVEIGMMSDEGYFVRIARSGRMEFPRKEPVPASTPEWLTVQVHSGKAHHAGLGAPLRPDTAGAATFAAPPQPTLDGGKHRLEPADLQEISLPEGALPAGFLTETIDSTVWKEIARFEGMAGLEGAPEELRGFYWEGPTTVTHWESGPLPSPVELPRPTRELFVGQTRVFSTGQQTHVVYGPWQVVIRGVAARGAQRVLARWDVHRRWTTEQQVEIRSAASTMPGSSERSGSESRLMGSSEQLLMGSSAVFYLAASELRLSGASELSFAGASERRFAGASERHFAGSSDQRFVGASERRPAEVPPGTYPSALSSPPKS